MRSQKRLAALRIFIILTTLQQPRALEAGSASTARRRPCAMGQFLCLLGGQGPALPLPARGWGLGCPSRVQSQAERRIRIPCVFLTRSLCKEQCGPQNTTANDSRPAHQLTLAGFRQREMYFGFSFIWTWKGRGVGGWGGGGAGGETPVSVTAATQLGTGLLGLEAEPAGLEGTGLSR